MILREMKLVKKQNVNLSTSLVGYTFPHSDSGKLVGGIEIYIQNNISNQIRNDMPSAFGNSLTASEVSTRDKKCVICAIYRHTNNDIHDFTHNLSETLHYLGIHNCAS